MQQLLQLPMKSFIFYQVAMPGTFYSCQNIGVTINTCQTNCLSIRDQFIGCAMKYMDRALEAFDFFYRSETESEAATSLVHKEL